MNAPVDVLAVMRDATDRLSDAHAAALDEACAAVDELIEVASATFPRNLCATNPNVADSAEIDLTATYGELRKLHAAIARCKGGAA